MHRIQAIISAHAWVVWALSASLFFVSFLHPWLWWSTILALTLLLRSLASAPNLRQALIGCLGVGIAKAAGGTFWIWSTYPLVWLKMEAPVLQVFLIALDWLYASVAIGGGLVLCAVLYPLVRRDARFLALFPFVFVFAEVLGSLGFSIFFAGPGSALNALFTLGYAGVLMGSVPFLLPFAQFGGVYALSWWAAAIGLLLYMFVFRTEVQGRRRGAVVAVPIVLLVSVSMLVLQQRESTLMDENIIAVETRFPAALFTDPTGHATKREEVQAAVAAALAHGADVVVLPEDSRFTTAFPSVTEAYAFVNEQTTGEVILIDSSRVTSDEGETWLRAFIHDTSRGGAYAVDKQYLVPHGEYVPYAVTALASLVGMRDVLAHTETNQNYRPGPLASYGHIPEDIPGVLFCFESVSPFGVRELLRTDTPFIAHVVSHAWFHDSTLLTRQLESMLRIQAVWSGAAIVQAGNMAPARLYRPDGRIESGELLESDAYWSLVAF